MELAIHIPGRMAVLLPSREPLDAIMVSRHDVKEETIIANF